jgi:hypothetical protein
MKVHTLVHACVNLDRSHPRFQTQLSLRGALRTFPLHLGRGHNWQATGFARRRPDLSMLSHFQETKPFSRPNQSILINLLP